MSLTLTIPPVAPPVSIDEAKAHLRITDSAEDTLITGFVLAATRIVESRTGLALMAQSWRYQTDNIPDDIATLPVAPLISIDHIAVVDALGGEQVIDPSRYEASTGRPARLKRKGVWPVPGRALGGVIIDFTAGFEQSDDIPDPLKLAIKLLTGLYFEQREAAGEDRIFSVPQSVDALIAPYRGVLV